MGNWLSAHAASYELLRAVGSAQLSIPYIPVCLLSFLGNKVGSQHVGGSTCMCLQRYTWFSEQGTQYSKSHSTDEMVPGQDFLVCKNSEQNIDNLRIKASIK